MKRTNVFFAVSLLLALSSGVAHAQYLLRYKFVKGAKWVYQTHMMVQTGLPGEPPGQGMFTVHGDGDTTISIVRILSNGGARIYSTTPNFLLPGSTAPSARNVKTTYFTMSPIGRMSAVKLPVSPKGSPFMVSAINPEALSTDSLLLPVRKVRQGDSWSLEEPNPIRNSPPWRITTRFTKLLGTRKNPVAVLTSLYDIPVSAKVNDPSGVGPGMTAKGKMIIHRTTFFSVREGKMLKTVISGTGKIHVGPYGNRKPARTPMDVIITMQVTMRLTKG